MVALSDAASRLIEALGRRGWVGDRELIDDLERLASATPSTLTALNVELDELGEALDQSVASVAYLDLDNAMVWPAELSRNDDEYTRWHRWRDDRRLGRVRAWLAEHGYRSIR